LARSGLYALLFQELLDGRPPYLVPQRPEDVSKPRVAPRRVVDGRRHHQGSELVCGARTPGSSPLCAVVLRSHQLAIPAQNSVGRDDASQVDETTTTDTLAPSGQPTALQIRESDRLFTQLFTKHSVLFFEVRNHPALLSLQPTRDHGDDEVQRPDFHEKN